MHWRTIFTKPFKSTLMRGAPQGNESKRHWSIHDSGWWGNADDPEFLAQGDISQVPRGPFIR